MNIAILSIFRNASSYIERYFDQTQQLRRQLLDRGDYLYLLLGHGDSTDDTDILLNEEVCFALGAELFDVAHGGPEYFSVVNPERMRQLAGCANALLDQLPENVDVVGWVESDLVWDTDTLLRLIDHTRHVPAVAPLVKQDEFFYDTWAFRKNGEHFTHSTPYCKWLDRDLMELDSAGSVLFVRAEYARKARFDNGEAIVGFSRSLRRHGATIWCDPTLRVEHPCGV